MRCCSSIPIEFFDAAITSIPYTPLMQAQYGPTPRVFIWYYDAITGEFLQSSFFTLITFSGDVITVDHGGNSTGFVVIR